MFIAGAYLPTFDGSTLGQVEDGISLDYSFASDEIKGDNLGDTTQDDVFRGLAGAMFLEMTLTEFNAAGVLAAFWPWSATWGRIDTGIVGQLGTGLAKSLVLTKVSGPNATPTTLTALKAVLAPGYPIRLLFAPRLRRVPLRLKLYPYTASSVNQFFTIT